MGKSPKRLAGEAQVGLFPWWGILLSWALELLLLVAVIVVPAKLASMQPYEPPPKPKYDIIYYSGNELPRTEDVGGAEAGVPAAPAAVRRIIPPKPSGWRAEARCEKPWPTRLSLICRNPIPRWPTCSR